MSFGCQVPASFVIVDMDDASSTVLVVGTLHGSPFS